MRYNCGVDRVAPERLVRRPVFHSTFHRLNYTAVVMLDKATLQKYLSYNPETGIFTWNFRDQGMFKNPRSSNAWNTRYANKECGHVMYDKRNKYRSICINGKQYLAHRLAVLYMTGSMPEDDVDHIDGNGLNNTYENIRPATNSINSKNQRKRLNNKSGVTGVYWCKSWERWVASINENGSQRYLGCSKNMEDAVNLRISAEKKITEYGS